MKIPENIFLNKISITKLFYFYIIRINILLFNPFVGRENSTKSAQSGRKIFYPENLYPGGFEGADYESELEIQKFKMADPIWWTKMQKLA